jgi:hypothetical protein
VLHVIDEIIMIANDYRVQGIGIVAIPVMMWPIIHKTRQSWWPNLLSKIILIFPLYDESQDVAKAFQAACTPDFIYWQSG